MKLTKENLRACFSEDNMFSKDGWFIHTMHHDKEKGFFSSEGYIKKKT